MTGDVAAELAVQSSNLRRNSEPVTLGVPWPRGAIRADESVSLLTSTGVPLPVQRRALECWSDGSVRWLLLDLQLSANHGEQLRVVADGGRLGARTATPPLDVYESEGVIRIDTGAAVFQFAARSSFPIAGVAQGQSECLESTRSGLIVETQQGERLRARTCSVRVDEHGPLRASVYAEARVGCRARAGDTTCETEARGPDLELPVVASARIDLFAGSPVVRVRITLHNPRRAKHPGGIWELGDEGSVHLREASLTLALGRSSAPTVVRCSLGDESSPLETSEPFELFQASSGGDNWQSRAHLNRHGEVPLRFRGYRLRHGASERCGLRATPLVSVQASSGGLGFVMSRFWQQFPKAVSCAAGLFEVGLFPQQHGDLHEIQGGERKSHTFFLGFGADVTAGEAMEWCRQPVLVHPTPAWFSECGAIPYLLPRNRDSERDYLRLVDQAIEGESSFFQKREQADEYGWRNFGEIYADHEAARHTGGNLLMSHYNNQYDALGGLLVQFLRSGDSRWWDLSRDLASHTVDIDVYHTVQDKPAYNKGLFWHTAHYVDADKSTHRTYPGNVGLHGGGPSNEHCYTSGLRLWHLLTGDDHAREVVLDLSGWIISMDDGCQSTFRWLSRARTGLASATCSPNYHGPGRGPGNAINALLDAYNLSTSPVFLTKAEELIRRCVHPDQDIDALALHDVERRWSYTVFLHALARYLDEKFERNQLDAMYAYAQGALLAYGEWMLRHEYYYLDRPELLEFPTETWAAQELRKAEVFALTSMYAREPARTRMLEAATRFMAQATGALLSMPSRGLARPVVLTLSFGWRMECFRCRSERRVQRPFDEGARVRWRERPFVTQRSIAKRRLLMLAGSVIVSLAACLAFSCGRVIGCGG